MNRWYLAILLLIPACTLVPTGVEYFYDVEENQVQTGDYTHMVKVGLSTAQAVSNLCDGNRACIIPLSDADNHSKIFVYQKGDACAERHEGRHKTYGPLHSKKIIKCERVK